MVEEGRKPLEIYKKGQGTWARLGAAAGMGLFAVYGCLSLRNELAAADLSAAVTVAGHDVPVALLVSAGVFLLVGLVLGLLGRLPGALVAVVELAVASGHLIAYRAHLRPADVIAAALFCFLALGILYVVNVPRVVDFLIATEVELRKVSWPSRPELMRQTLVVVVTVVVFAVLILVVDLIFARIPDLVKLMQRL